MTILSITSFSFSSSKTSFVMHFSPLCYFNPLMLIPWTIDF
ncbi:hypothetical protein CHCC5027_3735 [Bacillus paralicheniformis]|nr:hypothetical protein CHCC5027_3735 [Bacillus paralicheniformis]